MGPFALCLQKELTNNNLPISLLAFSAGYDLEILSGSSSLEFAMEVTHCVQSKLKLVELKITLVSICLIKKIGSLEATFVVKALQASGKITFMSIVDLLIVVHWYLENEKIPHSLLQNSSF